MAKRSDIVTVIDNGEKETMERGRAIDLYYEAMLCSEGSAQSRYCQIYLQLCNGDTVCTDEC